VDGGQGDKAQGLFRIAYDSVVALPFGEAGEAELRRMMETAQRRNAEAGITGVLRFDGAYFLQVLEGPRAAVEETMARIRRDPRHTDIRLLSAGPLERRDFAEWSMVLLTEAEMAAARRRNPDLLEVFPFRTAEVVHSLRKVLDKEKD
jgi:hypothetical protein